MTRRPDGYVQQRGGKGADAKYVYRIRWPLPDEVNAETKKPERREGSKTIRAAGKKEAQAELAKIVASLKGGTYVAPAKVTVSQLCDDWLASRLGLKKLRANTYDGYELHLKKYVTPRIGTIEAQRLTTADIEKLYQDLLREGSTQRKLPVGKGERTVPQGLSPRTILHVHRNLRQVMAWAKRHGVIADDPTLHAERPKVTNDRGNGGAAVIHALDDKQLVALLTGFKGHPLEALVRLAARTGMRRGELLALRWRDIDFDKAELHVERTLVEGGGVLTFDLPKTDGSRRTIVLGAATLAELDAYWKAEAQDALKLGMRLERGSEELVFPGSILDRRRPLHPRAVTKSFTAKAHALKFAGLRLHDLRHTHATLLLKNGGDLKTVSQRLGHANPSITLNIYQHVLPGMQGQVAGIMDKLLGALS